MQQNISESISPPNTPSSPKKVDDLNAYIEDPKPGLPEMKRIKRDNTSWNFDLTSKLITLRLTKYRADFENCGTHNRDRNKVWMLITEELGVSIKAGDVSKKYRDLYSQYNTKKAIENRSGEGSCPWLYMPVFDAHTGGNIEESPPGKIEVGGGLPADLLSALDDLDKSSDDLFAQDSTKKSKVGFKRLTTRKESFEKAEKVKDLQILALEGYVQTLRGEDFPSEIKKELEIKMENNHNDLKKEIKEIKDSFKEDFSQMFAMMKGYMGK